MPSCPQPHPPWQVTEAYHAGVDRGLLNVPCNARDKGIPVLEVCVEVSLWELDDRNIWLLENRPMVAGCPGNKLLPTHTTSSLQKAMSPSACHLPPPKPTLNHTVRELPTDRAHIRVPPVGLAGPRRECLLTLSTPKSC